MQVQARISLPVPTKRCINLEAVAEAHLEKRCNANQQSVGTPKTRNFETAWVRDPAAELGRAARVAVRYKPPTSKCHLAQIDRWDRGISERGVPIA